MVKNATRVWFGGVAVVLGVAMVFAIVNAVEAGSSGAKKEKSDKKGYLGVFMQELDGDVREGLDLDVESGVLISGVEKGGPADEAGLADGDVIVAFNGQKVDDPDDLKRLVRDTKPGEKVEIEVIRDGKTKTLTLTVGEWPDDPSWLSVGDLHFNGDDFKEHIGNMVYAFSGKPRLGVEVSELNEDLAGYFKTKAGQGVLVLDVDEESVAGDAGVKAGDVIVKVGEEEVKSVDALRESVGDYEEGDEFDIQVVRKGKKKTLKATMDETDTAFRWSGRPDVWMFDRHAPGGQQYRIRPPRVGVDIDEDLREELQDLREELEKMKKEIKELKK